MRQIFIDNCQEIYRRTLSELMNELYIKESPVNSWIIDALERHIYLAVFEAFREGRIAALTEVQDIIEDFDQRYKNSLNL